MIVIAIIIGYIEYVKASTMVYIFAMNIPMQNPPALGESKLFLTVLSLVVVCVIQIYAECS